MNIKIIAVGKIKEKYLAEALTEYKKRLSKFCNLSLIEIKEETSRIENDTNATETKLLEGKNILSKIGNEYVVSLAIEGKELSTIEFYNKMQELKLNGTSDITFIIGGSYGLSDEVKNRANYKLSFSKLTFPHQLFRVILLEQIYRIFKIENNEPYHK